MKPKILIAAWICALAFAGPAFAQQTGPTLYKRLGGYDALAVVTDDFLARLSTDTNFTPFSPVTAPIRSNASGSTSSTSCAPPRAGRASTPDAT